MRAKGREEKQMNEHNDQDQLTFYGRSFGSRLLLGTARYDSPVVLANAILAADPAMVTVSLRRQLGGAILPHTAGCFTAREAVKTACMARQLCETKLIKLEVISDDVNL